MGGCSLAVLMGSYKATQGALILAQREGAKRVLARKASFRPPTGIADFQILKRHYLEILIG